MIQLFGYPGGYPNVPGRLAEEQRIVWMAELQAESEQAQEQQRKAEAAERQAAIAQRY